MWSGDNTAKYDHLINSVPMSIIAGLCGMPMTGADLGGFAGDTTPQLLTRWHQAALFGYPLFRNHCSEDSAHREPYLFDNFTFNILRNVTKIRYHTIPLWYTAIQFSHETGIPPVLPLFALYPEINEFHDISDQFIFANSLLVSPVLQENAQTKKIIKPPGIWYNWANGQNLIDTKTISVTNTSLPVYIKGGSIIPFYTQVGSNVEETRKSPIALIVGCDENGNSRGPLYMDDGISYNYRKGEFMNKWIVYKNNKIQFENRLPVGTGFPLNTKDIYINEIKFYGLKSKPELINRNSELICNENEDICTMKGFKLYPYDGSNDEVISEKNKKMLLIIIIGAIALVVFIVIIIGIVVACKKIKAKRNSGVQDNIDHRTLIEND